jgi:uncharacterized membrane protein
MNILFIFCITALGLAGFLLSSYIYRKKKSKKKLICPMHSNCDTVIHSDYSTIIGIPVEALGMFYYGFISLAYGVVFLLGLPQAPTISILVGISACSVLFSIYLVSLQAFVLRHYCAWCISSALISLAIFILSYLHLAPHLL